MKSNTAERGAAILEFAMVTPVLLLVIAGIAESGFLFRNFEVTVNAAREGARLAVLPPNQENDYATVRARVTSYLTAAKLAEPTDPMPPEITITPEAIPIGTGLTANGVRVTVTAHYRFMFFGPIVGLLNGTFAESVAYRSSALMRTQVAAVGL